MRVLALGFLAAAGAFAPPNAHRSISLRVAAEEVGAEEVVAEVVVDVLDAVIDVVDAVKDVVEEAKDELTSLSAKDELMSVISASSPAGAKLSSDLRSAVIELLIKLEPSNPTESPATSPLLNGVWDVVYSGYAPGPLKSPTRPLALALYAGGFSPGLAALSLARMLPESIADVGGLTLSISREQPRCEATSSIGLAGMGAQELKVFTTLETETSVRLKETYTALKVAGRSVDVPQQLQYTRTLYVTYLDNDILVVRDDSGVPDVLLRKSMPDFLDEGVPSSDDDDFAPGAG